VNGAGGDSDGDGRSNGAEFLLGSSPLVPNGGLPLTLTQPTPSTRQLRFPTTRDRVYVVEWTDDLTQAFQPLALTFTGTGGEQVWTDDGSLTGGAPNTRVRRFYRVKVLPPANE
jgi:hypothetical protein